MHVFPSDITPNLDGEYIDDFQKINGSHHSFDNSEYEISFVL